MHIVEVNGSDDNNNQKKKQSGHLDCVSIGLGHDDDNECLIKKKLRPFCYLDSKLNW